MSKEKPYLSLHEEFINRVNLTKERYKSQNVFFVNMGIIMITICTIVFMISASSIIQKIEASQIVVSLSDYPHLVSGQDLLSKANAETVLDGRNYLAYKHASEEGLPTSVVKFISSMNEIAKDTMNLHFFAVLACFSFIGFCIHQMKNKMNISADLGLFTFVFCLSTMPLFLSIMFLEKNAFSGSLYVLVKMMPMYKVIVSTSVSIVIFYNYVYLSEKVKLYTFTSLKKMNELKDSCFEMKAELDERRLNKKEVFGSIEKQLKASNTKFNWGDKSVVEVTRHKEQKLKEDEKLAITQIML